MGPMSESELISKISRIELSAFDSECSSDESNSDYDYIDDEPKNVIVGMISQLKKGMDLHKVPFPTFVLEPRSMLERITDFVSHPQLILNTPEKLDSLDRFLDVVKYYLSGWHIRPKGAKKPYNPVLGEIFRCKWDCPDSTTSFYVSEQVCHHPPTSAYFYANPERGIVAVGNFSPKPKFLGNSIVSVMNGETKMYFTGLSNEEYIFTYPNLYARGLLFGTTFLEIGDDATIKCDKTDLIAEINFKVKGYFSGSSNAVSAKIYQKSSKKLLKIITGKWCDKLYLSDPSNLELKELFLDVGTEPICKKVVAKKRDQDAFESRKLWSELTKFLKKRDYNSASAAKSKVEDAQRQLARLRTESGIIWHPKFFNYYSDGFWYFIDKNYLSESPSQLTLHLNEVFSRRDFDFKSQKS